MNRSGTADLPLHGGRVPSWLAERMTELGTAIAEQIVMNYGPSEFLTRLSDPIWFQAYGSVMGMDWHSSGITTSVLGALKRGVNSRFSEFGFAVCGGRGRHSVRTPDELRAFSLKTGLNGDALARTSRLTARVHNNAVGDGFQLYLHSFVISKSGEWAVVQQGMNPQNHSARRYQRWNLITPIATMAKTAMQEDDWRAGPVSAVPDSGSIVFDVALIIGDGQRCGTVRFESPELVVVNFHLISINPLASALYRGYLVAA